MADSRSSARLRPAEHEDYYWIYQLVTSPEVELQWHHHGELTSFDTFAARLGDGSLHLIVDDGAGTRVGYASCYGMDFRNGHAAIAFAFPSTVPAIFRASGPWVFLDHLFRTYPFRKLYGEIVDFNLPRFRRGFRRFFDEEGRLREHVFVNGAYRDVVHVSITREGFERGRASFSRLAERIDAAAAGDAAGTMHA